MPCKFLNIVFTVAVLAFLENFFWEISVLILFKMDFFGAADGSGGGGRGKKATLPKIYVTYPTMTKLGTVVPCLKKI